MSRSWEWSDRAADPAYRESNRRRAAAHYEANREARKTSARAYYWANRPEQLLAARARKLGIGREVLRHVLAVQGTTCAICHRTARLSVDHDHETGQVRGLVCVNCNFVLGHAKDDPAILRAAAAYLEVER